MRYEFTLTWFEQLLDGESPDFAPLPRATQFLAREGCDGIAHRGSESEGDWKLIPLARWTELRELIAESNGQELIEPRDESILPRSSWQIHGRMGTDFYSIELSFGGPNDLWTEIGTRLRSSLENLVQDGDLKATQTPSPLSTPPRKVPSSGETTVTLALPTAALNGPSQRPFDSIHCSHCGHQQSLSWEMKPPFSIKDCAACDRPMVSTAALLCELGIFSATFRACPNCDCSNLFDAHCWSCGHAFS